MKRDTTTHLFRPMLGVKTCPGVVGRVMDFSFGLNFRFFFDVFFFSPVLFGLPFRQISLHCTVLLLFRIQD